LVVFLITILYPFKTTIVPQWRIHVLDETGAPVRAISVTEHWQHYTLEAQGREEILKTDETGWVDFPERTVRGNVISRLAGTIQSFVRRGANGRLGPYASIVVWGSRNYETAVAVFQPEMSPQTEIVIHRQ
jgi:hypothetical protein